MQKNIQTIESIFQKYAGEGNPIPIEVVESIIKDYKNYSVVPDVMLVHFISSSEKNDKYFCIED